MLDRFFGFIFDLPIIKYFKPFYQKRKDIVLYIFFGGLTTIVSFVTFWLFEYIFNLHELIANSISWVAAVAFAFFTNRIWVFNSPTYSTRITSYNVCYTKLLRGRLLLRKKD